MIYLMVIFQPRKALLEQLSTVLGGADEKLPDTLFLVNTQEWQGQVSTVLGGADEKLPDTLFLVNTQEWQGQVISHVLLI